MHIGYFIVSASKHRSDALFDIHEFSSKEDNAPFTIGIFSN